MRTEQQALRLARQRDEVVVDMLERERAQGWPAPFDWEGWRQSRKALVEAFHKHGADRARIERVFAEWPDPPCPQVVDNPVHNA